MKQLIRYNLGASLSYAEYGEPAGFPILIQHGLIASINDYHLFDRLLQLRTRLICIARPGYGESSPFVMRNIAEWSDIVSVLVDELKLSRFDVLGMSSGAPYGYALGYRFPEKARNIFVFSGIPALYDERVQVRWPHPVANDASLGEMEKLARELFFSNLSEADLSKDDIEDSMMNNCFGIAQDLRLRTMDWGFRLADVKERVFMHHSQTDDSVPVITAAITAALLPNCKLDIRAQGEHFSEAALDHFIRSVMAEWYENREA